MGNFKQVNVINNLVKNNKNKSITPFSEKDPSKDLSVIGVKTNK